MALSWPRPTMPDRWRRRCLSNKTASASCGRGWMMTRLSQPTEFQTGFPTRRVERYVAAARAVLAFERLWPALWPASGLVGAFLAAALFGVIDWIPWPLHALLLSGVITACGFLLFENLRAYAWPRWQDGARKLERDTGLSHRPLS